MSSNQHLQRGAVLVGMRQRESVRLLRPQLDVRKLHLQVPFVFELLLGPGRAGRMLVAASALAAAGVLCACGTASVAVSTPQGPSPPGDESCIPSKARPQPGFTGSLTDPPALAGLRPLRIGPFFARRAILQVRRRQGGPYVLGKLFYVVDREGPDAYVVQGRRVGTGERVGFQVYGAGGKTEWRTRLIVRKADLTQAYVSDRTALFMPGGVRLPREGCYRLTAAWSGGHQWRVVFRTELPG